MNLQYVPMQNEIKIRILRVWKCLGAQVGMGYNDDKLKNMEFLLECVLA